MENLKIYNELPPGFFEATPENLYLLLPSLSLVHLRGQKDETLFLSCLLHGNENSGFFAIQKFLKENLNSLDKSLIILFGNLEAARYKVRRLDSQPDFNRIWKDSHFSESTRVEQIKAYLHQQKLCCAIDFHNTNGRNPHFVCINKKNNKFFQLAQLFHGIIVYFDNPEEVLAIACAEMCPSVTAECGPPDNSAGVTKAYSFLTRVYNSQSFEDSLFEDQVISYNEIIAKINIPERLSFNIGNGPEDINLNPHLEDYNFKALPPGIVLAKIHSPQTRFFIHDGRDNEFQDSLVTYTDNSVILDAGLIPSMLTLNQKVISQDCLGYLMLQKYYSPKKVK